MSGSGGVTLARGIVCVEVWDSWVDRCEQDLQMLQYTIVWLADQNNRGGGGGAAPTVLVVARSSLPGKGGQCSVKSARRLLSYGRGRQCGVFLPSQWRHLGGG
jgi:hypothetical protein